jgi:NhaP-type Na+/H+ and K+/H+ antiporter
MNYYYDELYNDKINIDNSIRNINIEQIITNNILINIDALINYINSFKITNGTNFQLKIMESKLLKILRQYMKSKIFVENWNKFKESIALDWTKQYIELYFDT